MAAEINTLFHIHSALHHVLTRETRRASALADHADFSERIQTEWTDRVEAAVAPLVRVSVLARFVDVLEPDSRHEWHVLRGILDAEDAPEVAELIALRMVKELLRESFTEAETPVMQAVRKLMMSRLFDLLHHEKAALRTTAVRLLATQERNRDANASELAQYEVRRLLSDADGNVSRAAAETLAHLGLRSVVPLPAMLSLKKKLRGAGAVTRREKPAKPRAPARTVRRPRASAPRPGTQRRAVVADTILAFYRAVPEANLLERSRVLTLLPATRLEALRMAVLETWRVLALVMATPLAELIDSLEPSDLFHEFRILIMERSEELTAVLGASPRLAEPLHVVRMEPGDPLDLWHRGEATLTVQKSPFLQALLAAAPRPTIVDPSSCESSGGPSSSWATRSAIPRPGRSR